MEKLATRDGVAGVVGPYTSATANADAKVAERYKTPLLVPVSSKEEITRQGLQWTFRLSGTTGDYAAVLLDLATTLGKPKTMAILNENTDFGVSAAQSAREIAEKKGIKAVFEEAYSKGSPDYRSTLVKVKGMKPDLVFMVSYVADAILLMRQSREIGLSPWPSSAPGPAFRSCSSRRRRTSPRASRPAPSGPPTPSGRARRPGGSATRRSSASRRRTTPPPLTSP